jgi:hypothetical protein
MSEGKREQVLERAQQSHQRLMLWRVMRKRFTAERLRQLGAEYDEQGCKQAFGNSEVEPDGRENRQGD